MSSGSSSKKKRRQFSLKEKVDILSQVDAGKKQIHIANEMGVAPSTVATILKDRQKILELHRGSQLAPSRKRLRLGNFEDVDAAVLIWFKDARSQNVPVSGPMLQEKARQFADALDITGFEASAGWLHRFRERNRITWQVVSGEEKAAAQQALLHGGTKSSAKSSLHTPKMIYSMRTKRRCSIKCFLIKPCILKGTAAKAASSPKSGFWYCYAAMPQAPRS